MDNGTYCLPEPCDVAKIWVDGGIWGTELIKPDGPYSNISYIQFMRWNAAALHEPVFPGDTICIRYAHKILCPSLTWPSDMLTE